MLEGELLSHLPLQLFAPEPPGGQAATAAPVAPAHSPAHMYHERASTPVLMTVQGCSMPSAAPRIPVLFSTPQLSHTVMAASAGVSWVPDTATGIVTATMSSANGVAAGNGQYLQLASMLQCPGLPAVEPSVLPAHAVQSQVGWIFYCLFLHEP